MPAGGDDGSSHEGEPKQDGQAATIVSPATAAAPAVFDLTASGGDAMRTSAKEAIAI